jgi:hypothetical protein
MKCKNIIGVGMKFILSFKKPAIRNVIENQDFGQDLIIKIGQFERYSGMEWKCFVLDNSRILMTV